MKNIHYRSLATLLGIALSTAACGSSGDSSASVLIEASEGGVIVLDDDVARLEIPANALSEDTEITVSLASSSEFAALASARDRILVIEPDGVPLGLPATVMLAPGGALIAVDEVVSIAQLVDGSWVVPDGAAAARSETGERVTAAISVLAPVAVVVRDPVVEGQAGRIEGWVLNYDDEQPLPDVTFRLRDVGGAELGVAVSDDDGGFAFEDVPVGTLTVHADVAASDNCTGEPVDHTVAVAVGQASYVTWVFQPGPCPDAS